jgi:hypothetical protein
LKLVAHPLVRNATQFSFERTPSYVGQVVNLRPIVNRPADQYAQAAQAG